MRGGPSRWRSLSVFVFLFQGWLSIETLATSPRPLMVGVAKVNVTPTQPVVLAGYGARTKPFEEIETQLWARVCVIGMEKPVALLVLDNCGVPQSVTDRVADRVGRHGISKDCLMIAATHTHNAPSLVGYAPIVWAGRTSVAEDEASAEYTRFVVQKMELAIVEALKNREPMFLEWARGRVTFGGNRRVIQNAGWRGFGLQRDGPVDHSLPVLAGRNEAGELRLVWANYACHCTTVGSRNTVGGDWAGYANMEMEALFPNAISLMSIGCGADVGPQPTGSLILAREHGKAIAAEVASVLEGETTQLTVEPKVVSKRIQLPLEDPPAKQVWEQRLQESSGFNHQLAKLMLQRIQQHGDLPRTVDYPISVCSFGNELAIVFLGGEVVVDYAAKLSSELDWNRSWVTAWTNAMPGYIPTERILAEGGYEADFSQVYYGHPTRYSKEVERVLIDAIKALAGPQFASRGTRPPEHVHQPEKGFRWEPDHQAEAFARLGSWVRTQKSSPRGELLGQLQRLVLIARPAVAEGTLSGGGTDRWNDFAGDQMKRSFIRQQNQKEVLRWNSPGELRKATSIRVFCFSGGTGWVTQPETEGFQLEVNNGIKLRFDVTRELTRWATDDEQVEMFYLPTWQSDEDTGGFFVIALRGASDVAMAGVSFAVRSAGGGSKRWFAIDTDQGMPARLQALRAALQAKPD
jgi:neutral ceramidase